MSAIFTARQQQEILQGDLPRIDEGSPCPFDDFPNEVKGYIFNFLASNPSDFANLSLTCRQLYVISKMVPPPVPESAFGKAAWKKHFETDVGEEPPLPPNIHEILQSPCPYWEGKKTGETHDLLLIPKTVDGKPFTMEALQKIAKKPLKDRYEIIFVRRGSAAEAIADFQVPASYWALITKDVLPNSRNKSYPEQQSLLEGSYTVPKILEVATEILMHYTQIREMVSSDSTWTRCQETSDSASHFIVPSSSNAIRFYGYENDSCDIRVGMAGVRRLT